jgi:hypothetical protein
VQDCRITPEVYVRVVAVECAQLEEEKTAVQVTCRYTALLAVGEHFISKLNPAVYIGFIEHWRVLLTKYFERKAENQK